MTREEAIEMLKKDKEQRGECFISDALDMAIKTLEQEPVLDKIRSEIKALPTEHTAYGYDSAGELWTLKLISSDNVLGIIDKYKAESEDRKLC